MAKTSRMPPAILLALTVGPAIAIGATLWFVADLVPECTVREHERQTAPDRSFDLVVFTRTCTTDEPNMQAALLPVGDQLPVDAASFVAVSSATDLEPRWDGFGNIEVTLPEGAEIVRQDANVAGVDVVYR